MAMPDSAVSLTSPARDDNAMHGEHDIQINLLNALEQAWRESASGAHAEPILQQLIDYSEMHFMSEQLLMRLYAYPDYEAHEFEHQRLLAQLREWQSEFAGSARLIQNQPAANSLPENRISALRYWLLEHIKTQDAVFGYYMRHRESP